MYKNKLFLYAIVFLTALTSVSAIVLTNSSDGSSVTSAAQCGAGGCLYLMQGVTFSSTVGVEAVEFAYGSVLSANPRNLSFSIQRDNGLERPNGIAIPNSTYLKNYSTFAAGPATFNMTLPGIVFLNASENYYLVFNTTPFTGGSDSGLAYNYSTTANYPNGSFNRSDGIGIGNDMWFFVYGNVTNTAQKFSVTATDLYDSSSITSFQANATINGTTASYSTTNGSINFNFSRDASLLINITLGTPTYFEKTYFNHNATSNLAATLFQAQINFTAQEILSNASITPFTVTAPNQANTSASPVLYLKAGDYNVTFNKSGWYNQNFSFTVNALDNRSQNLSGVYQYLLNISVTINNASTANNFNASVKGSNSTYTSSVTTTNGSAEIRWINDTNLNITVTSTNSQFSTASILYNTSNFTAPVYINVSISTNQFNSIYFFVRYESNFTLITNVNATIYATSPTYSTNISTTSGAANLSLLTPENYTITVEANGFNQRQYFYHLQNGSTGTQTLYLLETSNATIFLSSVKDLYDFTSVSNATVSLYKKNLTGTNYPLVEQCKTNKNGECLLSVALYFTTYQFQIVLDDALKYTSGDTKLADNTQTFQISISNDTLKNFFEVAGTSVSLTNGSNSFTYTWNEGDTTNIQEGCLYVYRRTKADYTNTNSSCSSGSSGSITIGGLDTSLGDEYVAVGSIKTSTATVPLIQDSIVLSSNAGLGSVGFLFIGIGIIVTSVAAFLFNPVSALAMGGLATYLLATGGIITLTSGAVIGVLILIAFLGFRMRA